MFDMDRRTLLAGCWGVAAWPPAVFATATVCDATARLDLRYVVTDRRYRDSLDIAAAWVSGVPRLEVADGLTPLWQAVLLPLWRVPGSGAVAGVTSRPVFDCLAEQARSHGRHALVLAGRPAPVLPERPGQPPALVSWVIA